MLGPTIEKMVGESAGEVLLAKVDIDDLADIAMDYQVLRSNAVAVVFAVPPIKSIQ